MTRSEPRPLPFVRSKDSRVITGVAGGLALALGVNPWIVRICFILMAFGSGIGLLAYGLAYLVSAAPDSAEPRVRPVTARHTAGVLCIAFGVLGLAATTGSGLPRGILTPVILLISGSVIIWARLGDEDRALLARESGRSIFARTPAWRLVVGGIVLAASGILFIDNASTLSPVLFAIVTTIVGLSLLLGPWLVTLAQEATQERRERIRNEERADISAHLHDSVLNTLALIQRSDAPSDVITLARRQERELRAWMQGRLADENDRLDVAVDAMVTRVEAQYNVSVDAVVVGGDIAMDEAVTALVSALQEAAVNGSCHAGVDNVSVYVEIEPEQITAFVRDQGQGFDPVAVPDDRRGIADSIEGRMRRVGGSAVIRSVPGEGTEVELRLPRTEK